jgi:Xaa-Pro aminopeptidase
MKYTQIDPALFIGNRARLAQHLLPGSMAIVGANDILPTNADGTHHFKQHSDLFYLTGVAQEETIVVIFPDCPDADFREVLFLRETSPLIESWEGHKLTKEEAYAATGIKNVQWTKDFWTIMQKLTGDAEHIYLNSNEHKRAVVIVETRDARLVKEFQARYPLHSYKRVAPVLFKLRSIKQTQEIELLQKAADITEKGYRRVLQFLKPGVTETQIEAEYVHEFIWNGGTVADYSPIIASGINACTLHYHENSNTCMDGDLVLMDVGAGYANYNADMTRTVPVNGRYTPRQKQVYNAVLRVMKQVTAMLVPGNMWKEIQKATEEALEKECVDLGLFSMQDIKNQDPASPLYKKYFFHGVSHFLGLDVHDVGYFHQPYEAGMVFTVEPGLYIKEEKIGIRIENNILITPNGPFDLFRNFPIEADEIEAFMQQK